ncbi:ATP-binding protein [Halobacteriovorax sp. GB3]|uniref:ATP-binding protein n=1 Tax=Halobacteriovorax sp. GB3 TaxID=2719615 RepID=UPI00235E9C81|nr:ATP-binding protein [Halobacteriovorax sp. GB3]MDD0853117.1 ATP-binding protein [Halobacteriovorax sp. GB3]
MSDAQRPNRTKLQYKLLRYILICSTFFSFLGTAFQLYIDYKKDISTVNRTLDQIESIYTKSLANSLWHLDKKQLVIQATGMKKLPDIEYIGVFEIRDGKRYSFYETGTKDLKNTVSRTIPLTYRELNEEITLGNLVAKVNLNKIYQRLWDRVLIILMTQSVKTFIVSLCILIIINVVITKKIERIADYAGKLSPGSLDRPIEVEKIDSGEDEIDDLIKAINNMRINLKNYIAMRDKAEYKLQDYKEHLEELVHKRTKELQNKTFILQEKIDEINTMQDKLIAQEKLASLGSLTSGIAHELNNPLNFIINFSEASRFGLIDLKEMIDQSNIEQEKKKELLEEISEIKAMCLETFTHGKRAESIITSMLEHSRESKLSFKDENIVEVIEENINFASQAIKSKYDGFQAIIHREFEAELPLISISKVDIATVFLNLFTNALYSMKKKKDILGLEYNPELLVRVFKRDHSLYLIVRDNGLGIKKEDQAKVFTPFFTTKAAGEGTGLGLSLSFDIINKVHEGHIEITSKENEYAEFTVILPLIRNKNHLS